MSRTVLVSGNDMNVLSTIITPQLCDQIQAHASRHRQPQHAAASCETFAKSLESQLKDRPESVTTRGFRRRSPSPTTDMRSVQPRNTSKQGGTGCSQFRISDQSASSNTSGRILHSVELFGMHTTTETHFYNSHRSGPSINITRRKG